MGHVINEQKIAYTSLRVLMKSGRGNLSRFSIGPTDAVSCSQWTRQNLSADCCKLFSRIPALPGFDDPAAITFNLVKLGLGSLIKSLWYLAIFITMLPSCVQPFDVEVEGSSKVLVADGLITNQKDVYKVRLSYASPTLNSYEDTEISGAQVSISNNQDQTWALWESEAGVYQTDSCEWQGKVGSTYQLHIITPDGKRYASYPETMPEVPAIDSFYYEIESRTSLNAINSEIITWGLQTYLNTGSGTNRNGFYRWDWRETYEFTAPLAAPGQIDIPTCYESGGIVGSINIASTRELGSDIINRQPINFIPKRGVKLSSRYSLLIKQLSLTQQAYDYWENVKEQLEDAGSIFSPPPAQIIGNIYNVDDDTELVMGYFQVSAVTEKRVFIRRGEVPADPGGSVSVFPECNSTEPAEHCYDCRLYSPFATTTRPSFW